MRKQMIDRQVNQIKKMSMQQLVEKQRLRPQPLPPDPTERHLVKQTENIIRNAGFTENVEEVAKTHLQMIKDAQTKNRIVRRQMRQAPIMNQIKRGKLGFDNVLILFAIFGSFALPFIFYHKFKGNKQTIVKNRKYSPEVIENISDDSPIDIDEVSEQTIMYDNPDRRMEFQKMMKKRRQMTNLKNELDL